MVPELFYLGQGTIKMIRYSPACEKKTKHSAQLSALTGKGFRVCFSNGVYSFLIFLFILMEYILFF